MTSTFFLNCLKLYIFFVKKWISNLPIIDFCKKMFYNVKHYEII